MFYQTHEAPKSDETPIRSLISDTYIIGRDNGVLAVVRNERSAFFLIEALIGTERQFFCSEVFKLDRSLQQQKDRDPVIASTAAAGPSTIHSQLDVTSIFRLPSPGMLPFTSITHRYQSWNINSREIESIIKYLIELKKYEGSKDISCQDILKKVYRGEILIGDRWDIVPKDLLNLFLPPEPKEKSSGYFGWLMDMLKCAKNSACTADDQSDTTRPTLRKI